MCYGVAFLDEQAGQVLGEEDLHQGALARRTGLR